MVFRRKLILGILIFILTFVVVSAYKINIVYAGSSKLSCQNNIQPKQSFSLANSKSLTETFEKSIFNPTEDDEEILSRTVLKRLLTLMIVLFVIMCFIVIILVLKIGSLQSKLDDLIDKVEENMLGNVANNSQQMNSEQQNSESNYRPEEAEKHISRNKGYAIDEDTGEIQIEEALDNNISVNVPPAVDSQPSKIENAMKERPYGIDSAFDVISTDNVYDLTPDITEQKDSAFSNSKVFYAFDTMGSNSEKTDTTQRSRRVTDDTMEISPGIDLNQLIREAEFKAEINSEINQNNN
ncbi:MAG: hypothetical protein K6B68_07845 [Eubacterium sp.]|nr:hypothetical protein [Eubacterium sp.]